MSYYYLKKRKDKIRIATKHFAGGGEGNLYRIETRGFSKYVAKIYHADRRTAVREAKIQYLLDNPPEDQTEDSALVWVTDALYDEKQNFMGFIMPMIKGEKLEVLCLGKLPRKLPNVWKRFDFSNPAAFSYRLRICFNLAVAVYQVHQTEKYVLVDMKPDNVIIQPNGLVSIVDMDSVEVIDEMGEVLFAAPVATPEYTPPEFYREKRTAVDPSWDRFGMAVIFYKILFGIHPFAATANPPHENLVSLHQKIEEGLFVHHPNPNRLRIVPPPHKAFHQMELEVQELFLNCFVGGHLLPSERPSAEDWCDGLLMAIGDKKLAAHFEHIIGGDQRVKGERLSLPSSLLKEYTNDIVPATWGTQKIKETTKTVMIPDRFLKLDIQQMQTMSASVHAIDFGMALLVGVATVVGVIYGFPAFFEWLQLDFWLQPAWIINLLFFGSLSVLFWGLPRLFSLIRHLNSETKRIVRVWNALALDHQSVLKQTNEIEQLLADKIRKVKAPKLEGKQWDVVRKELREKDQAVGLLLQEQKKRLRAITIAYRKKGEETNALFKLLRGNTLRHLRKDLKFLAARIKNSQKNSDNARFRQTATYWKITEQFEKDRVKLITEQAAQKSEFKEYLRGVDNVKRFVGTFFEKKERRTLQKIFDSFQMNNFRGVKAVVQYPRENIIELIFRDRKQSEYISQEEFGTLNIKKLMKHLEQVVLAASVKYRNVMSPVDPERYQKQLEELNEAEDQAISIAYTNYFGLEKGIEVDVPMMEKQLDALIEKEVAEKEALLQEIKERHQNILEESKRIYEPFIKGFEEKGTAYKLAIDQIIASRPIQKQKISLDKLNQSLEKHIKVLEKLDVGVK
jgi:serine/threonine protein kinase